MCYALYLGTDEPLPTMLPGDADNRFHLETLEEHRAPGVMERFSKPHVYYAASWQDCGCGWFPDGTPFETPRRRAESRERTKQDVSALRGFLACLLERHESVQLVLDWDGGGPDFEHRDISLSLRDFEGDRLPLELGDYAVVEESPLT